LTELVCKVSKANARSLLVRIERSAASAQDSIGSPGIFSEPLAVIPGDPIETWSQNRSEKLLANPCGLVLLENALVFDTLRSQSHLATRKKPDGL